MKIVVSPGMLKAARKTCDLDRDIGLVSPECEELRVRLEAALLWQKENVRVPLGQMLRRYLGDGPHDISNMRDNIMKLFCSLNPDNPQPCPRCGHMYPVEDLFEVFEKPE